MPAYHPRSTRTQRPAEALTETQILAPLKALRRTGDTRPLPRVEQSEARGEGTTPTLPVVRRGTASSAARRARNGRVESRKLRTSHRAVARAALLFGSDLINPILVGLLGLAVLAAAGILWAGSNLDISGSSDTPTPATSHWDPRTDAPRTPLGVATTNANDDTSTGASVDTASAAPDEPTQAQRQIVAPAVVDTSASPSGVVPPPMPESSHTPGPVDTLPDTSTPENPPPTPDGGASSTADQGGTPSQNGSPSDASPGTDGTGLVTIGLSLQTVEISPTS